MHSHRLSSSSLSVSPPPSPQPTVSASKSNRGDQIVQSIYGKFTQLILQARVFPLPLSKDRVSVYPPQRPGSAPKVNRWFNLETDEIEQFRSETRYWRNNCILDDPVAPLFLEIYLDASELSPNQIVVLVDEYQQKHKIDLSAGGRFNQFTGPVSSSKSSVLLESWCLRLECSKECSLELPAIYKHGIAFFRSILTFVKALPSSSLVNRLRRTKKTELKLGYRLSTKETLTSSEIGFDKHSSPIDSILSMGRQELAPFETPLGVIKLSVTSRRNCSFYLEDGDKLLSSKFQSTPLGSDFTLQGTHDVHSSPYGPCEPIDPYGSDPRTAHPYKELGYTDHHGSPNSSTTSLNSINKNIQPSTNLPGYSSRSTSRNSAVRSRPLLSDHDLTGSKSTAERSSSIYFSLKSSPPSHITMGSRRSPSITMFSPFKSPSLSSSPSFNNASPPSRTSSFGNRSSASLERGIHQPPRATPSPSIRPASPGHSRISSSFGQRFGSFSGTHLLSENNSSTSLIRRNPSLRDLHSFDKPQRDSNNESPGVTISRASHDELTEFMKILSNPPTLMGSLDEKSLDASLTHHDVIKEYKKTYTQLEDLAGSIDANLSRPLVTNSDYVDSPLSWPLLQTGFKAGLSVSKDEFESNAKSAPIYNRLITSREFVSAQTKDTVPGEMENDLVIQSQSVKKCLPRASLLSQKLSIHKNAEPDLDLDIDSPF